MLKKVICISNVTTRFKHISSGITVGKHYIVLDTSEKYNTITICDDFGFIGFYPIKHFEDSFENKLNKLLS